MYLLYVRVHCIHNTIYVRLMYIIVYNAYNVYSVPLSAVKLMFMYRQSPKLKTGYRYENQFYNPGFTNGVRQFCEYQYFCNEILFFSALYILHFFESLKFRARCVLCMCTVYDEYTMH